MTHRRGQVISMSMDYYAPGRGGGGGFLVLVLILCVFFHWKVI